MTHRSPRALLLIAGTLALAGCERPDPVANDLRKASDALDALHTSVIGIATVTDDVSAKRHEKALAGILGDAGKHVNATSSGQAASALLLQARASAGLAELGAERVNAHEATALAAVHAARGGLDTWLTQTTRAAALEAYSPAKEFKELDDQLAKVEESVARATAAKAAANARIADLEKRSAALLAQAKGERTKAAELKVRAAKVSATEGLALVEDATKIARAADGLERQASDLAADADAVRPDAVGAENGIKAGAAARDQLTVSRNRVQERADGARRDAGAARAEADKAAKIVNDALAAMATARGEAEGLTLAGKTPIAHFSSAVSSATGALKHLGPDVTSAVNASIGAYNQKLGDLYVQRARSLTVQVETLRSLAAAKPALPLGGDLSGRITETDESARKAADDARQAYESAKTAFEKAGARGEVKESYEKVAAALDRLLKRETAAPAAAPAKTADTPATEPADAKGSEADIAAVREAMAAIITMMKEGKASELGNVVVAEQRSFVETGLAPVLKIAALDDACREKFSKSVFDVVKGSPLGMMLGMMAGPIDQMREMPRTMAEMKPESLVIKMVSATRAEITGGGQELTEMLKEDGAWKLRIALPPGADVMGGMNAMPGAAQMMTKLGDAVAGVTADLKAGKIESAEALSAALNKALMPILQGGMMPPPGGG